MLMCSLHYAKSFLLARRGCPVCLVGDSYWSTNCTVAVASPLLLVLPALRARTDTW